MDNEQLSIFENSNNSIQNDDIKKEIEDLRKQIEYHNKRYYEEDEPEISDFEYDKLTQRLKELESLHPEYVVATSPTQKVGGRIKNIFTEVKHEIQMQSLQDVFDYEAVQDFVDKIKLEYGENLLFTVETKIDGLSVSLEYEDGILTRGSTRGDGFIGEDVTQNLLQIDAIPKKLNSKDTIEVRGEVYLPRAEFEKINDDLFKKGKQLLANPRNAAAGTLRQLDTDLVKSRHLSIFIFNVQSCKSKTFKSHIESLEYCKKIGFTTIGFCKLASKTSDIIDNIKLIGNIRDDLDYDIDGAVVKVDDLNLRKTLGSTVKVPKWAVAFKYPPEQKQTKILDIVVQVGRTGQVTPMAILEPVKVAGSQISKATLHNFDYLTQKDIRKGDICIVQKAGDVIPEIIEVIKEKRDGSQKKFEIPTICPVCGEKLEKLEDEVALRCTNSECPAQIYRSLIHFTSRDAMDISGVGEALIDKLIDNEVLKDVADIYYIKPEDIKVLYKNADKAVKNVMNSIEKSKSNLLDKLIFGLGIRHIGKKAATLLAQNFSDIYEIIDADIEKINNISDFGEIMAQSVYEFFRKPKTLEIIEKLKNTNVNLNGIKKEILSDKLNNMSIVVTGSFDGYSRKDLENLIEKNSGSFSSSVSKNTSFILAGQSAGSKLDKANKLGIKVIDIDEFKKMLDI